ncbi:TrkH family potassium uptake protein [Candidatus Foliamicus sp.]
MQFALIASVLGRLLMLFSVSMLTPVPVDLYFGDGSWPAFAWSFAAALAAGCLIWLPFRRVQGELKLRDGFLIVASFWVVLGSFGAVPLLFAQEPEMAFTDALFEAISGLTTTGATVLAGLDEMPRAILYYRQQLQWLGGLGIVVLAVAVLPILGVGGMQLYRAETPGPMKDNRLTPRIKETAKALWYIYLALTAACAVAYRLAGMSLFDAICHAFTTVAIGGFSTHDESFGFFPQPAIRLIAIVFMFLAAINFALHFVAFNRRTLAGYFRDAECRAYAISLVALCVLVTGGLLLWGSYGDPSRALLDGIFQSVSIMTTTGFVTADFSMWPGLLPMLLILSAFMGGCAGSTAGGMKCVRIMLLVKQGVREVRRLVHPSAEIPVTLGDTPLPKRVIDSVWGFFAVYVAVFVVILIVLEGIGLDSLTAFAAVAATLNNLGPGLGEVASGYGGLAPAAKWACIVAMLLGRLEIFTFLVLLSPTFWRP